jgi:hypothetical protein
MLWFKQMREKGASVTGKMVRSKAASFAEMMGIEGFKASEGWLYRLKVDEKISFKRFCGEALGSDKDGGNEWVQNVLPGIIEGYEPRNIFNADETGLFYRGTPKGTLTVQECPAVGGRDSKERLTFLIISNMDGSEKHGIVIGKSKRPRCFRRGEEFPLQYHSNRKAWMTREIWTKIINWFDKMMVEQGRNVVMFVDNATCHRLESQIEPRNTTIRFLPVNTTSVIQPLDMGIIRSFKAKYLDMITRKRLALMEENTESRSIENAIDVKVAMVLGKEALSLVTSTTIRNCFKKHGEPASLGRSLE